MGWKAEWIAPRSHRHCHSHGLGTAEEFHHVTGKGLRIVLRFYEAVFYHNLSHVGGNISPIAVSLYGIIFRPLLTILADLSSITVECQANSPRPHLAFSQDLARGEIDHPHGMAINLGGEDQHSGTGV